MGLGLVRGGRARALRGALVLAVLAAGFWVRGLSGAPVLEGWWPWTGAPVVTLYFSNGQYLFPVSRRLPAAADLPGTALQALIDGPAKATGLASAIPPGVEIRSVVLTDGIAYVDLSGAFSGAPDSAEAAVLQTMAALPGVRSVALSVEGKPVRSSARPMPLLYYASDEGLVAVPAMAATPGEAIAEYLAGPPSQDLMGVPRDVRLLEHDFDAARGLIRLRFAYTASIRTLALERPDIMRSVLIGLIASLTEFPDVLSVQVDFEGRSRLGLGQCSDLLSSPQPRPRLLNDERLLGR